jgi:hypothetical protein
LCLYRVREADLLFVRSCSRLLGIAPTRDVPENITCTRSTPFISNARFASLSLSTVSTRFSKVNLCDWLKKSRYYQGFSREVID